MPIDFKIGEPPFDFDIVDDDEGNISVTYLIASDTFNGVNYFAEVALSPYDEECPEYSFSIIEYNVVDRVACPFMSGLQTEHLFTPEQRHAILGVIVWGTVELLHYAKPKKVYRCTNDPNPPEKALEKHYMISLVFRNCGYRVVRCDDWCGQRVWIASLISDEADCEAEKTAVGFSE